MLGYFLKIPPFKKILETSSKKIKSEIKKMSENL